jgi:hypothetical protein
MSVNVTFDYVYFSGGPGSGHTRQPRSPTGPGGGFTLISSVLGGQVGPTFSPSKQPAIQIVNKLTYTFAFMNVSGGIPAGQTVPAGVTSFDPNVPPAAVTVGSAPIVVLVVYGPPAGTNGGGGPYAVIDSFNETTGQLFDDTFVSVSPDPGGALTKTGNVDGYVSTTNTEAITALTPTSPTNAKFDQWVLIYPQPAPGATASGTTLTVTSNTTVYELAFYKTPPPPPLTTCQELLLNWNALQPVLPKTQGAMGLLEYYEEKLSACSGPQYAAAVTHIKQLISELNNPPK